ncbi:hypothetical protein CEXT_184631 [Caerostris extrusa]|uniref:LAGLIDADG homing endonuclease n=1 Tax=Caerostris extrusa TaxID=172846 RepID=A0AAV4P7I3_CAEEX|nr:hypothetical protein CEXT_184631 [Caerostris extrusa]
MLIASEIPNLQKYSESIPEGNKQQRHSTSVSVKFDFLEDNKFLMSFQNKNAKARKLREFLSIYQVKIPELLDLFPIDKKGERNSCSLHEMYFKTRKSIQMS